MRDPTSHYTAVQMRILFSVFMHHCIGDSVTDHYKRPARWLANGQPWKSESGKYVRNGGHTVYAKYWDSDEAAVLWEVIRKTLDVRDNLTRGQIRAFKTRQAWLAKHFKLNVLELMVRAA